MGRQNIFLLNCVLAMLMAIVFSACSTAPAEKSAFMTEVEGIDYTKRELETELYNFAAHFTGQVELASTEIYSVASNPDIRRAAIEWNLNATPELMKACFFHDPLVGMLGAWAFSIQMREFFEEGNGWEVFGPHQDIAIEVSRRLENDMANLVHAVWKEGDVGKYEQKVVAFAAANPLKSMRFVREGYDRTALNAMGAKVSGGLGAAGEINEQMVALSDRLHLMMPYFQRQIQWQSALFMEDSKILLSDLTDSTLVAVREEVFGHLDPIFEFVDGQRAIASNDIARERSLIVHAVAEMLASERSEVLAVISAERKATMRDLDALTLAIHERAVQESQSIVTSSADYVFMRTLQLLAIPFLLVVVFVVAVMLWVRSTVNRLLERL